MPEKEKPTQPSDGGMGNPKQTANFKAAKPKVVSFNSPRHRRLAWMLINAYRRGGWVPRQQIETQAGCVNAPDLILQMRRVIGHEHIELGRTEVVDRDGKTCRMGLYRVSEKGFAKLVAMLDEETIPLID